MSPKSGYLLQEELRYNLMAFQLQENQLPKTIHLLQRNKRAFVATGLVETLLTTESPLNN
ncbi:hypothetical protein AB0758_02800 [Tolypothrix bouteillei VB521301_2]|uniref:hypothetical protein n=1 Tax=Tolypothrix bouteillei TaxID=1246981 RepID=UPI0005141824